MATWKKSVSLRNNFVAIATRVTVMAMLFLLVISWKPNLTTGNFYNWKRYPNFVRPKNGCFGFGPLKLLSTMMLNNTEFRLSFVSCFTTVTGWQSWGNHILQWQPWEHILITYIFRWSPPKRVRPYVAYSVHENGILLGLEFLIKNILVFVLQKRKYSSYSYLFIIC